MPYVNILSTFFAVALSSMVVLLVASQLFLDVCLFFLQGRELLALGAHFLQQAGQLRQQGVSLGNAIELSHVYFAPLPVFNFCSCSSSIVSRRCRLSIARLA